MDDNANAAAAAEQPVTAATSDQSEIAAAAPAASPVAAPDALGQAQPEQASESQEPAQAAEPEASPEAKALAELVALKRQSLIDRGVSASEVAALTDEEVIQCPDEQEAAEIAADKGTADVSAEPIKAEDPDVAEEADALEPAVAVEPTEHEKAKEFLDEITHSVGTLGTLLAQFDGHLRAATKAGDHALAGELARLHTAFVDLHNTTRG